MKPLDCSRRWEDLDVYLDRELDAAARVELEQHLSECAECSRELDARTALRQRVRGAVGNVPVDSDLNRRVHASLRSAQNPGRSGQPWRMMLAAAAVLAVCAAGLISYERGHLRYTRASQEAYIQTVSRQVSPAMCVGLRDHLHCAVFRKYPENPPSVQQMTANLGADYQDLLAMMQKELPADYRVVMAHRCTYGDRSFVHVTAKQGERVLSLVISRKRPGESFEADRLVPELVRPGGPIYRSDVQRFALSGFESSEHLVYVISELGDQGNTAMLAAMEPRIREVLRRATS